VNGTLFVNDFSFVAKVNARWFLVVSYLWHHPD